MPALARFTAVETLGLDLGLDLSSDPALPPYAPPPLALATCADLVRAMPRLRDLMLFVENKSAGGGRAWLTDEVLEALASQPGSQLRRLHICGAACVTADAVAALLRRLPGLREVVLDDCPPVPLWQSAEALRGALQVHGAQLTINGVRMEI